MLTARTDLALEAAAGLGTAAPGKGVRLEETTVDGIPRTVVEVLDREGERATGKPAGRYVTLDLRPFRRRERAAFRRTAALLAREIARLLPEGEAPALVVCLGNRGVTPDAVGPLTHDLLLVTRHLMPEEGPAPFASVAAVAPGVLGATGIESGDLVGAIVEKLRPRCVVAVDALAAGSMERLCATVQLSDTGISPGSGVGNHRRALDRETLGVPVIAVGVPTVVDGATLALALLREAGRGELEPKSLGETGTGLFVTPRDIDVRVRESAKLVAWGINLALQPQLDMDELEDLTE